MNKEEQILNEPHKPQLNIDDVSDSQNKKLPNKSGWFWVLIDGYNKPTPCWYMNDLQCFLLGGLGDSSSMGIYEDEIEKLKKSSPTTETIGYDNDEIMKLKEQIEANKNSYNEKILSS